MSRRYTVHHTLTEREQARELAKARKRRKLGGYTAWSAHERRAQDAPLLRECAGDGCRVQLTAAGGAKLCRACNYLAYRARQAADSAKRKQKKADGVGSARANQLLRERRKQKREEKAA